MTLEWLPLLVQGSVTADWLADTSWLLTHTCSHTHTHAHICYCLRKKYYFEICNIVFSLFNSGQSILFDIAGIVVNYFSKRPRGTELLVLKKI